MCNDGVVERIREVINWCDVCLNDAEEQVIHQLWWMTQTGATDGSKRFRLRDSETKEQRKKPFIAPQSVHRFSDHFIKLWEAQQLRPLPPDRMNDVGHGSC
jgi:hypothetical protein